MPNTKEDNFVICEQFEECKFANKCYHGKPHLITEFCEVHCYGGGRDNAICIKVKGGD